MNKIILIVLALVGLHTGTIYAAEKVQIIEITVTDKGFEPSSIDVKPGVPVILKVTRKTDVTCATDIKISSKKIKKALPLNKTVNVALGKLEKGEIRFACAMDMITGIIHVQ